ncbi:hypothetical protein BDQ17DRAFT_1338974 [Cyathus striatus]|nr:hypothetical protein BDQ17DRAFT_1338974 [Cyathus striatus]
MDTLRRHVMLGPFLLLFQHCRDKFSTPPWDTLYNQYKTVTEKQILRARGKSCFLSVTPHYLQLCASLYAIQLFVTIYYTIFHFAILKNHYSSKIKIPKNQQNSVVVIVRKRNEVPMACEGGNVNYSLTRCAVVVIVPSEAYTGVGQR